MYRDTRTSSIETVSIKALTDGQVEIMFRVVSDHHGLVERGAAYIQEGIKAFAVSEGIETGYTPEGDSDTERIRESELWDALEEIRSIVTKNSEKIVGIMQKIEETSSIEETA